MAGAAAAVFFAEHSRSLCLGPRRDEKLVEELKSEIKSALINKKANACPMAMRIAWHSAGTYDARDGSGGTNGATMR